MDVIGVYTAKCAAYISKGNCKLEYRKNEHTDSRWKVRSSFSDNFLDAASLESIC